MRDLRKGVLACFALAAAAWSCAAQAVPPVMAPPSAQAAIADYIEAVEQNDFSAYAKLFATDADIISDWPRSGGREVWLSAVSTEFAVTRRTRFLAVFSGFVEIDGQPATRALIVQEIKDCRPDIIECFGQFRSETLTIRNGQIVALERRRSTHRLLDSGEWTFFAP